MLFSLTNPEVAILMMVIFLFAVLLGFPIAFTLMAMGVGFGYYAYFDPTWKLRVLRQQLRAGDARIEGVFLSAANASLR